MKLMNRFHSSFRESFSGKDVEVTFHEKKRFFTLRIGTILHELHEAGEVDTTRELKSVLFGLAAKSRDLENKLGKAERVVESLQKVNAVNRPNVFEMTSDSKRKKNQPKAMPKQVGMSVINPGSKKRAKAKGVEFN